MGDLGVLKQYIALWSHFPATFVVAETLELVFRFLFSEALVLSTLFVVASLGLVISLFAALLAPCPASLAVDGVDLHVVTAPSLAEVSTATTTDDVAHTVK